MAARTRPHTGKKLKQQMIPGTEPLSIPDIPPAFMVQAIAEANAGLH